MIKAASRRLLKVGKFRSRHLSDTSSSTVIDHLLGALRPNGVNSSYCLKEDFHVSDELELIFVKGFAYVSGVENAEANHFEDELGPFKALIISRHSSLMDGNVIDWEVHKGQQKD